MSEYELSYVSIYSNIPLVMFDSFSKTKTILVTKTIFKDFITVLI